MYTVIYSHYIVLIDNRVTNLDKIFLRLLDIYMYSLYTYMFGHVYIQLGEQAAARIFQENIIERLK